MTFLHVFIFQLECTSPNSTQRFFHTEVQICFRWVVGFQRQWCMSCSWSVLGVHQHWGVCARHRSGLGTRGRVLPVQEPWASSTEPRAPAGPGWADITPLQPWDGECPPCSPAAVWWALPWSGSCCLRPRTMLCLQLQHTIPVALNLGTYSSSGMYFSALLLHHLQITADLCLQVLSHKHPAAAGVLCGNWIALSDLSVPAQWLPAKQASVPRKQ